MNRKALKVLIGQRDAELGKIDALLNTAELAKRELTSEEQTTHRGHIDAIKALDLKIATCKEHIALREAQDVLTTEAASIRTDAASVQIRSLADPSVQGPLSQEQIKTLQRFSYVKGIREMLNNGKLSGLELEMHQEAQLEARNAGAAIEGNFAVPLVVMQRAGLEGMQTRAITATGTTSATGDQGGLAIQTNVGSIIERFYAKLQVRAMGTTILDGLVGNVLFPRHVKDDKAAAKSENAAAPVTSSTMSSLTLAPRRVPVVMEVSRQFTMQTSPGIEAYLREDLSFQLAKIIDQYCLTGSGSTNQPYGILNIAGINQLYAGSTVSVTNGVPTITPSVIGTNANGAALSYADLVLMLKAVAILDAEQGKMGFLTNPAVKAALQLTPKFGSTFPNFVWPDNNDSLLGYKAGITTQMPSNLTKGSATTLSAIILANWADALMGQWGGLDMLINPYSKDDQGLVRINAWSFFDFNVRRPQSFVAISDVIA